MHVIEFLDEIAMNTDFLVPVSRTTVSIEVCRTLLGYILAGDWKDGDRLPGERELCRRLGVGRASLREALKGLQVLGMIEMRQGEGTFVSSQNGFLTRPLLWAISGTGPDSFSQLYEARRVLEGELAALAAERATDEELSAIEALVLRMEAEGFTNVVLAEADVEFHLSIAKAARNVVLQNLLTLLLHLTRQMTREIMLAPTVSGVTAQLHRQLYEAIKRRDAAGARAACAQHFQTALDRRRRAFAQPGL